MRCQDYVGVACVDGSCPKILYEEYEGGLSPVIKCKDCFCYKGCEDCALYDSEYCDKTDVINMKLGNY